MGGHGAWNENKDVAGQKVIAESLLAGARNPGPKPVRIGHGRRLHDMDVGRIDNGQRGQQMWNRVEGPKPFVYGDFEYGGRRIDGAIDRANAFAVPAPPDAIGAFAAVPRCPESLMIQTPRDELARAKCAGQGRHT